MKEKNLPAKLARLAKQESELSAKPQTMPVLLKRAAVLKKIQEILKKIKASSEVLSGA